MKSRENEREKMPGRMHKMSDAQSKRNGGYERERDNESKKKRAVLQSALKITSICEYFRDCAQRDITSCTLGTQEMDGEALHLF